jgi:signal transduction histidine kinase
LGLEALEVAALARDLATAQSLRSQLHRVEVRAPEAGVWVEADRRYLTRALSNLMDNAIKYWPSGGTVVVEIASDAHEATIRVIDHGIGIAAEDQPRLFSRFQRAVPEGVNIPGTGIGLFSVKRIVEAHGGTVNLLSATGQGSIFTIVLPLAKQPAGELARSSAT